MKSSDCPLLRHILIPSVLLEIPENPANMPDIDCPGCKNTEMVFTIGCNDYVAFRDLEGHVDKRSPVETRG